MSSLKDLIQELNLSPESLGELAGAMNNPFAAMQKVQELGIPMDFFQKAFQIMMANPNALTELATEMGLPAEEAEKAKAALDGLMNR